MKNCSGSVNAQGSNANSLNGGYLCKEVCPQDFACRRPLEGFQVRVLCCDLSCAMPHSVRVLTDKVHMGNEQSIRHKTIESGKPFFSFPEKPCSVGEAPNDNL